MGGSAVDLILSVPRLPKPDEKLVAEYVGRVGGGFIANTACASARLGLHVGWTGQVGDDDNGNYLLDEFKHYGIDYSTVSIHNEKTTDFCVILIDPTGERTILVVPTLWTPPLLKNEVIHSLRNTRIAYSMPREPEWFLPFAQTVHEGGGKVAIDIEDNAPVSGNDLISDLHQTDIIFCNKNGLHFITNLNNQDKSIEFILSLGVKTIVVTRGKDGASVYAPGENHHIDGFSVPVVDSTGAGDCFHAAFIYGLLANWPLKQSLHFANAAGAISVQQQGARGALPTSAEIETFIQEHQHEIRHF